MSGFFATARDSAAAEFGRRNYRTFAYLAWARRLTPALSTLGVLVLVLGAAGGAAATRESWTPYAPHAVAVLAAVALLALAVWAWRNRWRWQRW